ncbi:hypothetical protein H4R26_001143 [Coemansia thaxteri]|uniref:Uncharacterized protein n=1 Tax=Coemansia thaxteri TaxID=2663907 RepID=A0A9W8BMA1_9FUNG|nr:hypothetical protein H4R26_001143 [Coemansia thaxteri]KAJ2474890.1 hypothetical protein EV174_005467 [Coemansia sp. RSA 2320]
MEHEPAKEEQMKGVPMKEVPMKEVLMKEEPMAGVLRQDGLEKQGEQQQEPEEPEEPEEGRPELEEQSLGLLVPGELANRERQELVLERQGQGRRQGVPVLLERLLGRKAV